MNDRQRIRLPQIAGERLLLLAKVLDTVVDGNTVMGRMRDQQGPLRARSYEPTSHARTGGSSNGMFGVDQAVRDEAELDRRLRLIAREVRSCWDIVGRYPVAHHLSSTERAALIKENNPERTCESCCRVKGSDGQPRQELARPGQLRPTDVGGRLDEPMMLCTWCYGCVTRWNRLPTEKELERHHRGSRVPWPFDVPKPR